MITSKKHKESSAKENSNINTPLAVFYFLVYFELRNTFFEDFGRPRRTSGVPPEVLATGNPPAIACARPPRLSEACERAGFRR